MDSRRPNNDDTRKGIAKNITGDELIVHLHNVTIDLFIKLFIKLNIVLILILVLIKFLLG